MKVVPQRCKVGIGRVVCKTDSVEEGNFNAPLFPKNIRAIVCGPSACGKTQTLTSLLTSANGPKFEHVHVVSPTVQQSCYNFLEQVFKTTGVTYEKHASMEDFSLPQVLPYSIVIFDDLPIRELSAVSEFFYRGRHANVSSFLLCQTYAQNPPQILRQNANALLLFSMPLHVLQLVHRDFVGADMTFDKFSEMCKYAFADRYGFLSIFRDFPRDKGRYRIGLDSFVVSI